MSCPPSAGAAAQNDVEGVDGDGHQDADEDQAQEGDDDTRDPCP